MSGPLERSQLAAALNADLPHVHSALRYVGEVPFGTESLARYALANGLSILFLRDEAADVVSYQTWFRVGSRHEEPKKTGLAHLFEHLMFNEVEGLGPGQFDRLLEAAGGEVNAATWMDWTFYYENVPSSELSLVIRLEALRMHKLVLREPQLSSEKEVVANERRYRVDDDVEGGVNEVLFQHAFTEHPYHWPTIGWMEDIEGFTLADCQAFYARYYAPNNACLAIVGNADERAVLRQIQEHYGAIAPSILPEPAPVCEPEQTAERVVHVQKPTPTAKLAIGYKGPAFGGDDFAALTLLNEVLLSGKSARLYRALITEGQLASDVRGSLAPLRDPGLYEIWVSMREGQPAQHALDILDAALARVREEEVSGAELDKAKARLELSFLHGMETMSGKAEQVGFFETVLGDPGRIFALLERSRALSAQEVKAAAQRHLTPARRTLVWVEPSESGGAPDGEVAA